MVEQNGLFQFSVDNILGMLLIFEENGTVLYANKAAEEKLEYEGHVSGRLNQNLNPVQIHIK